jgi:DNA-binding XRE family transcriptional regulator
MEMSLAALRVNAKLTQKKAASELGVCKKTLSDWETYKSFPNIIQLKNLCDLYGCTMDDVYFPKRNRKQL